LAATEEAPLKGPRGARLGVSVSIGALAAIVAVAIGASDAGAVTARAAFTKHAARAQVRAKTKPKPPVRAALPSGAIRHIFVIELENESEQVTFGPNSPATYLNTVLRKQGELLVHYYATGHAEPRQLPLPDFRSSPE
jgi:hypothetical protein